MPTNSSNHAMNRLGIARLSSHLCEAANILRGPVGAADFKTCIFPLFSFKRRSDVYDEEYALALPDQDVEGICGVVTLDEIRENDFTLSIPGCVEPLIEEEAMTIDHTIDQTIANLKESLQAAYAAEDRLMELLKQNGLLP